jgi:hypothetical protein
MELSHKGETQVALRERLQHEVRKVDDAGRLSLGRGKAGEQYDITEAEDGTVVLTPVAVIPKRELWLYKNSEAMALVQKGLAESARGEAKNIGSFAQYADDKLGEE